MLISFELSGSGLKHATGPQFGAIVAHLMKCANFYSVRIYKESLDVSFQVSRADQLLNVDQLQQEIEILSTMEPFPCPCGCGQFLAIGPCFEQSGEIVKNTLSVNERDLVRAGQHIAAIKEYRMRTAVGLREAKEACDKYRDSLSTSLQEEAKAMAQQRYNDWGQPIQSAQPASPIPYPKTGLLKLKADF